MSPIGSPHAACVARLARLFHQTSGEKVIVWVQNPVRLNDFSEPVPDIALLKPRKDYYAARHPLPADVLLLIEVAVRLCSRIATSRCRCTRGPVLLKSGS